LGLLARRDTNSYLNRPFWSHGAALLTDATNRAFDPMNGGFVASAVILVASVVVAFALIPKQMRTEQASLAEPKDYVPAA
jgi:hypothetical protein